MTAHSLQIGHLKLHSPIIQGPLAGYTNAAMREACWDYGGLGFAVTEMISAKTLIYQQAHTYQRYLQRADNEKRLCYQLSATDPQELATAVKMVSDLGADLIDLNCGCPKPKIRGKGAGSMHLSHIDRLATLIDAMRANTSAAISIKIRVDGDSNDNNNDALISMINQSGLNFVTVHGRHWSDTYDIPCRYDQITHFVRGLNIPVIGNGDIRDRATYKAMQATGCAGFMICRAGTGKPWLYQHLLDGESPSITDSLIFSTFNQHLNRLADLLKSDKFAKLNMRKVLPYYQRQLTDSKDSTLFEVLNF